MELHGKHSGLRTHSLLFRSRGNQVNFADLRQRAAFLAMQVGWSDTAPQPDWSDLVNRALVDFSWETEYNEEEITFASVANQPVYTVPTPYFKTVKDVAYATETTAPRLLRRTSETDERKTDPLWFTRVAATPVRYLIVMPNVIRLVDMASNSGDTVTMRGTRVAPALENDSDLPGFPDTWHEAIALRAAILHCEPWAAGDALARVQNYVQQVGAMSGACKIYLSGERYSRIQRSIERPIRRRSYIRQSGRY